MFSTDPSHAATLIEAISKLPESWALTPCMGKKNLWPAWNKERLDRNVLIDAIKNQKNHAGKRTAWTGVSLITGPMSGGVMAIDFDGEFASEKYRELSGGAPLPITRMWTSGKPGHFQILLRVPDSKWEGLKPVKLELENGHKLEFRWNQCSTLPPSIHPDTQQPYYWENWDENYDWENWEEFVPIAPDWVLDLMRDGGEEPSNTQHPIPNIQYPTSNTQHPINGKQPSEILEQEILPRLDAEDFYGEYLPKLKRVGKTLKSLCPFHQEKTPSFTISPEGKTYHCFGCGAGGGPVQFLHQIGGGSGSPSGKEFIDIVRQLGDRVGVSLPELSDRKLDRQPKPTKLPANNNNNVVNFPPQQKQSMMTAEQIEQEIDTEIESGVTGSRLSIALNKIAALSGVGIREVRQIYAERVGEQQQADSRADTAVELKQLLTSKSAKLSLSEILPKSLAEPIEKLAKTLNLRAEGYLLALLVQSGALLKNGTSTMLYPQSQFKCRPNYFGALVAESSQKKTPVIRAIITDPMERLLARSEAEYKFAKENYEAKLQAWLKAKDSDEPKPEEPSEKTYIFTKATGEGIVSQAQKIPEQGMLYLCDELAGAFKSANQYRGGRGSDDEDLLEYWSGGGAIVLRVGGLSANVRNLSLSIFGNIQPKILAGFVGDGSDANGKFARFDFVQQPLSATKLQENAPFISLTPMLVALYENLDALPAMQFELNQEARKLFINFYNHCEEERVAHPKQGMRAMLGKAAEKVGKLATILHCINAAHNSTEPLQNISADCVRAAIKFVMFTTDQALSLNMESCEPETLAPNLVKILDLAGRKGGTVSLRDVGQVFGQKYRPTSQQIQEWFIELVELQYGEIEKKGRSISLTLRPQPTSPTLDSNPLPARNTTALNDIPAHPQTPTITNSVIPSNVGDSGNEGVNEGDTTHALEPLSGNDFNPFVGDVGENLTDLDQLISRVRSAQTWAEVQAVWNGDSELKARIKAALTREELARIGRLYKVAHPEEFEKK
jgi:Protein of unknown function (DUF3987)/CHC2 zinc finger/Bifunctional DNA primase/polymerase, N-terminal